MDFEDASVDTFLEAAKALENINSKTYKVICTDLNMPVMSGMEFIEKIRKTENPNSETPIIIITGDNKDLKISLEELVNVRIVNKAENIPELLEMIQNCMES